MSDSFIEELKRLGFFKGLDTPEAEDLEQELAQRGWGGIFSNSYRLYNADAEELAEGGIGELIANVQPFLTGEGVRLPEIEDDCSMDGYMVRIGNENHLIYDATELLRDSSDREPGVIWGLSMARGFGILNEMLAAAGSAERVYAVNGGNDLFAFFLRPALHDVIMQHPDASPFYGPYTPTEEYPSFGQPQD